ncbi:transmembrane protein, putative, partial [Bodo saltans]
MCPLALSVNQTLSLINNDVEIHPLGTAPQLAQWFGVLIVVSQLSLKQSFAAVRVVVPAAALTVAGNKVVMLSSLATLVCGIAIKGSLSIIDNASVAITGNSVTVSTMQLPIGALYYVLGVAVLLPRGGYDFVADTPTITLQGLLILRNSSVQITGNTIRVTSSRSAMSGNGNAVVSGAYLGAEPLLSQTTTTTVSIPTTVWVSTNSRLVISVNNVANASGVNLNAIVGVSVFLETVVLLDTTSIALISNNSIAASGAVTATASTDPLTVKVMTVHAIQVSDSLANGNTSLRLRGASAFELSLNVIQVAGSATLSSANNNGVLPLFRAIGICVLASLFQQGASSTRTSVIRMATDSSSQLSVVENTISAWANFTLESPTSATVSGLPMQIVSAIYLGLEHGGVASTTFVVCATVRSQSRLTIAQNVISITSVNVNIAAIALFKGVRMLVDSASIVGITKNMLRNISGLTTISSVISSSFFPALAVIGVLVIDGSNLLAPFLAAPPYSGSFTATVLGTGGQHQILNGSLVVIANNAITFFVSRPQAVAGRAAPIVIIGVAWCMGSIGTLVVASQSWWTVTLNTIVLLNVGNATALAELIDGSGVNTLTAMRVVIVTKDMGVGALLLLNVSTCEVSDNALTVPAANDTALAFSVSLMAVQLYSVNTQIEGGAPATLLINGTNSAMTLSRNIILVRSVDQVKSFSGAIVVTSGIVLSVTNAAGIAVAIVGTSSIALDWNDGVGDGSRGRSILVSSGGPLSNAVRISKGFVMVTMTSDFATATAASVLLPYLSALADPILKSTVVLSGGATFSVQSSAAFVVSQLFLSISLTNSATQDKGAVLCLQDSSSFLIEGNEVDKVVSGDAIVLTLAFLLLQNNVSTVGMSFNVLGSSTVSVSRNIVRTEGDISSPLNLQRGIVVSAVGYSWTHVEPNCHEVTPSPPPPDHGHARTFMSAFDGSAPIPTPVPTECSPISTNYKLLPLNAFTMYSQLTLSSNVVTTIDVAIWVSLGRVLLMNTSSMLTIQLNVLQSSSGTAVLSAGTAASISAQNYYAVSCVVTCDQGAIVLVERNTLVMQQRPPATFRSYLVFSGTWSFLSNTSIFMIIRRNAGICLTTSRINQLMLFDSFTSVNISLTLLMGACDRVNGHTLTTAADYVRAGAPQPGLLRVINCTTFSSSEYLNTTETKSVVASASVSVAQSETLSETMVPLRHAPSPTRLDTISSDISQSVCITASATLTPSRTRFTNESSPTVGLNATATPSPSKMSLSLRASLVREHAAWRGGTLSLTYTPTNSRSTTVSRMPLGTSSPTLSFSGSCAPSDDLAVVAPLFPMFQLLADVRETEDFTPLLPSRGVLPGVWASPLDSLVFSRVVATPPIAASAESESTTLRVILCRRPVSYPTPTVVPAASLTSVFGNGTVVIANSSMSLFTVHQWMSADQTFLSGDILEVRFLVELWFNAAMDRRSARFNALPCRPQDSIVLAYVQLGGVLSSGQTAVQTTVGAVSTFTMIVSLLVGDGGNELQTMVLASMMECTPRGGSVQKSLGNLRSLAPLLLEESYLGVILGNLLLIGCVLGVQCVVMAVLALSRCAKNQPLRFGWATSGNEPSTNDAEVQSMEYSNDENTMAENHSRLLLQDDDEERAGLQAEDLLFPE